MKILVTGGLGFIGSNFILKILNENDEVEIINVDAELFGSNQKNLETVNENKRYEFVKGNITNRNLMEKLISRSDAIINFAAESFVDRSINNAEPFLVSNIRGAFTLMDVARKQKKRVLQISTDEVYGDLDEGYNGYGPSFENATLYPSSYYSATKAAADMLVYSCNHTFGLPYLITRTCNNFGIRQNKEKFIPTIIKSIKEENNNPVYGDGEQIREWIWVEDNVKQILKLMLSGDTGIYNIGSGDIIKNIDIINEIGYILGKQPKYEFVEDRLGHDRRYHLDSKHPETKITKTLFDYLKEQL